MSSRGGMVSGQLLVGWPTFVMRTGMFARPGARLRCGRPIVGQRRRRPGCSRRGTTRSLSGWPLATSKTRRTRPGRCVAPFVSNRFNTSKQRSHSPVGKSGRGPQMTDTDHQLRRIKGPARYAWWLFWTRLGIALSDRGLPGLTLMCAIGRLERWTR